jgi:hypothetical protein
VHATTTERLDETPLRAGRQSSNITGHACNLRRFPTIVEDPMKRLALLAVVAAVAIGLLPAANSGAAGTDTGLVTIVHDATYDASAPFPVTLCIDDEVVDGNFTWGDIIGPVELPAATYAVDIYAGVDQPCSGPPAISGDLVVAAGDNITAAAIWTSQTQGPALVVWPNDSSCVAAGQGRVTVRHGADTGGPVDIVVIVDGVESTPIVGLAEGAQASVDVPAPLDATSVKVVAAGGGATLIDIGPMTFPAGVNTVVYAGGGNDGAAGVFGDTIDLTTCATPTTPSIPPPAAQPATLTPAFTG